MKKGLFLLCFLLLNTGLLLAQPDTASITATLEQYKARLGKQYAFALFSDGKLLYKKEVGELNIKSQEPVNAASQWLTSALVMVLVQEGKINLDDKVSNYLPIFSKYRKGYITIRHCLTHNTGLDGGKAFGKNNFPTLEEEVNYFAVNREINTNPGTQFYYSPIGYKIVARVLEVASKKPFERLMKEKLTNPLAMRNTTFANDNYDRAPDAANGARSSAFDYLNFLSMLLNKGMFNGKQVLTEASVNTLLSLQHSAGEIVNGPRQAEKLDYSLGAWVLERNSKDQPVVFIAPSSNGILPVLDNCRGYAFVLFSKDIELKKEVYQQVRTAINDALKRECE